MSGERRPLATRELGISKRVAARLAAAGCTPNGISIAGMLVGILGGVAFWLTSVQSDYARMWFILGAALVQLRLLANMLDGMVAVENDLTSPVGELFNEIPDRVSDVAILVGFGYAAASWPVMGWIAAVVAVSTAYVRAQIKVAGGPQDFVGPMAKPHRMFLVTLAALYCGIAPAGWQPALFADPGSALPGHSGPGLASPDLASPGLAGAGIPAICLAIVAAGSVVTILRRLRRGARALRSGS